MPRVPSWTDLFIFGDLKFIDSRFLVEGVAEEIFFEPKILIPAIAFVLFPAIIVLSLFPVIVLLLFPAFVFFVFLTFNSSSCSSSCIIVFNLRTHAAIDEMPVDLHRLLTITGIPQSGQQQETFKAAQMQSLLIDNLSKKVSLLTKGMTTFTETIGIAIELLTQGTPQDIGKSLQGGPKGIYHQLQRAGVAGV